MFKGKKEPVKQDSAWTLVIYAPSNFFTPEDLYLIPSQAGSILYQEALLAILQQCTELVVGKWRALLLKFHEDSQRLQNEGSATFMDPNDFVDLLYDTAYIPRSRFYFWAIACLKEFDENIETNLREMSGFRRLIVQSVKEATADQQKNIRQLSKSIKNTCEELDDIRIRLQDDLRAARLLLDDVGSLFFISSTSVIRS
jgi:hypothetical protein